MKPEQPHADFSADLTAWDMRSMAFIEFRMPERARSWRHLRAPSVDHWALVMSLNDRPGRAPRNAGGTRTLNFRSLGRPFEGTDSRARFYSLFLSRDQFDSVAGLLDAVPESIPDSGLVALLADFLLKLATLLPTVPENDVPALVDATRAMIIACLAPSSDRTAAASGPMTATLLDRARRIIHENAYVPDFGPDELCRTMAVSRSRLYRLFEPFGGVANYVRRRRLLLAHAFLSDLNNAHQIRQIGEQVGFSDPSCFSRAFRSEFGYSPGEARTAARDGWPLTPPPSRNGGSKGEGFNDMLMRLHR